MSGGFIGVDVFFVISGYLKSTIIIQNLEKGCFSISEFYSRRIKRILPALILVMAACYAFGWFALLPDEYRQLGMHIAAGAGFAANFQLWSEAGYFDNLSDLREHYHTCTPARLADEALRWEGFIRCTQSKAGPDVDIALVGDSHAEHLFLGIADALPAKNVAFYTKGAPAFLGRPEFVNIFESIMSSKSIRHIVVASLWEAASAGVPEGSSLDKEISFLIDALTKAGKKVYIAEDTPIFDFTGNECKRYRWFGWKNPRCEVGADWEMRHYDRYISALRHATQGRADVKLLEVLKHFCDANACSMINGNEILYRDTNHLNVKGSIFIGKRSWRITSEFLTDPPFCPDSNRFGTTSVGPMLAPT